MKKFIDLEKTCQQQAGKFKMKLTNSLKAYCKGKKG